MPYMIRKLEHEGLLVQVIVRDNNVDQALRALKKKMQREGVFREMKLRRSYEKPSERRVREKAEAIKEHYEEQGILITVDAGQDVSKITEDILEALGHPKKAS